MEEGSNNKNESKNEEEEVEVEEEEEEEEKDKEENQVSSEIKDTKIPSNINEQKNDNQKNGEDKDKEKEKQEKTEESNKEEVVDSKEKPNIEDVKDVNKEVKEEHVQEEKEIQENKEKEVIIPKNEEKKIEGEKEIEVAEGKEPNESKDKNDDNKTDEKMNENNEQKINDDDKKEIKSEEKNINEEVDKGSNKNENAEIEEKKIDEIKEEENANVKEEKANNEEEKQEVNNKLDDNKNEKKIEEKDDKKNEKNEKIESEQIEQQNLENNEEKEIEEINDDEPDGNLHFGINENLIKIISDETLTEDEIFSKIMSEVKISSKNPDDIGIYIYMHFLFRNSYNLFMENNINRDENNEQTISDYLDDKITSFNFDKFMSYIKDEKISLKNKKRTKNEKNQNFLIFEFIQKEIDENDINADTCFVKNDENNNYKLIVNYDLIKNSMYSKGQHDLFTKFYIIYLLTKNNSLLQITKSFLKLITNKKFSQFDEEKYLSYVDRILKQDHDEINNIIDNDLIEQIKYFIDSNEKTSLFYLEKLLIQLLGNSDKIIRSKATKLLNVFYDGHILQLYRPFAPVIKYLKEDFEIEINLEENENCENYFLFVSTPVRIFYIKYDKKNSGGKNNILTFNLGKFKFCGYYDYVLINKDNLKQKLETKGRYIIQNNDIKYLNCHSLLVDIHNSSLDSSGKLKKQSSYKEVINSINYFSKIGINCVNLIGVLERDVYLNKKDITVSPLASINRSKICSLLGTEKEFKQIVEEGKKSNIKIFIDMLSSISSSHFHKKYNNLNLNYVDKCGKLQCLFGTEGDSIKYEDNMILNYRDINTWNLLISDVSELCEKYNISGIHLNNAQNWPQIYSVDLKEMLRVNMEDGQMIRHYSNFEIINGSVVLPNQECGYWNCFNIEINKNENNENDDENSSIIENIYPNPLFIKLTKNIWEKNPEFIFIGEFINNNLKYNNREYVLGKSGLVPKINMFPEVFTNIYNISTGINNIIPSFKKTSINDIIKNYYSLLTNNLPLNSYFISASGGTIWPYPSLLYGPGCIPYITALFSLNNIPMTYFNEIYGKSKRHQFCCYYDSIKNDNTKDNKTKKKSSNNYYLNKYKVSDIEKQLSKVKGIKSNNIKDHYEKMRILRQSHKSLLNGKLYFIKNDNNKLLSFCREDLDNNEIAFIAINFGDTESKLDLDFSYLLQKPNFQNLDINTIIKIENWDDSEINYYFTDEIFSKKHKISIMPYDSFMIGFSVIKPFEPDLYHKIFSDSLIDLCKKINDNIRNENNNKYKNKKFLSSLGKYSYDLYIISSQLKYILENSLSLCEFSKWLHTIESVLSEYGIQYLDYFNNLNFIQNIPELSTQYYKYIRLLNQLPSSSFDKYPKIQLYSDLIEDSNQFGTICFVTPEIGKWTSVGGLGIMVDELTQCLAKLGQEIIIISPYYHIDKNGKSNYLDNNENYFVHIKNIEVKMDKNYTFKIYFGKKNNIKYYFIYNKEVFPEIYPHCSANEKIIRLALFGKITLEFLYSIQKIPSIIVTNDWSTGFVPAYGKSEKYCGIFKFTSFLHIIHNLEEGNQDIIHLPNNSKENYPEILKLSPGVIYEKNNNNIINPSLVAVVCCDQWGTVSKSYRDDLLNKSNIKNVLKEFPHPFACSIGIFRENRIYEIKNYLQQLLKEENNNLNLNEINIFDEEIKNICKKKLQKKYFNENYDPKNILFSFLGRITEYKGIKIILDNAEELIKKYKAQLLIAGKANPSEKYSQNCIELMEDLHKKYPNNFWCAPNEYFDDPILLNGSDFCLMPSTLEPGGIVQHEYLISGTPVIAFKTGGLKDTIEEYNTKKKTGNGFLFDNFENKDFLNAVSRAVKIYGNKDEYKKLCSNSFDSAIDLEKVAFKWGEEFYKIKNKIFYDKKAVEDDIFEFKKNINNEQKIFDDEMALYNDKKYIFGTKAPVEFEKADDDDNEEGYLDISFILVVEKGKKYKTVQITGSWDKWDQKFDLSYDPLNNCWKTFIILPKGITYYYKYIVDNEFVININEKMETKDNDVFNIIET